MEGREERAAMERIAEALERSAVADEELIRLATAERVTNELEPLPPMCPRCGQFDPVVENVGGRGQLSEFVLVATCGKCTKLFLAVPSNGWEYARDRDELKALQDAKGGNNGKLDA